jgi:hypothetical protein
MDPNLILNQAGKLNVYTNTWELDVPVCPCDVHANEFVAAKKVRNGTIFHFGTGAHHIVGIDAAENGRNNAVFAITASTGEYDSYIKLLIDRPEVGNAYKAYFGDIYQLDGRLLPDFDVVTLFHLCEFRAEAQDHYGALTDLEMAKVLIDKLKPGGWVLFYTSSMAFDDAKKVIAKLEKQGSIAREPDFKTLQVYRKKTAASAKKKPAAKPAKARSKAPATRTKKKTK